MKDNNTFYITTPIYYPSDKLHIGHTYCTVATDAMARYKRLKGCDVLFLTGTDEHGQKIEDKAREAGMEPKAFVDNIVEGPRGVLDLWKLMDISNDRFIRTTDDYHMESVQKIFKRLYEQGDIYKGKYVGKYCKPCESFWTETQLVDGKCPDCGREVVDAEEEAYFFRLSKYAGRIQELLENTDFLEPRSRVNEMVNNFIKPGLEDLCVSRTSFTWGVPKSSKLLRFTLDCGEEFPRQILSGIHEWYEPEALVGKTVVACTNLKPRKMMGIMSNGMLISAVKEEPDGTEKLHLIILDDKVPAGYGLC